MTGREYAMVLTDVEGSTSRWEHDPDSMVAVMKYHDATIAAAVATNNGLVITERGEGDSAYAIFDSVEDAVRATVAFQRELGWLRVRAGIHWGAVADGYVGAAVNRCGRLRSLAHGGQTLLSGAAVDRLSRLPHRVDLLDLGLHVLRDVDAPEHVFQLCHPDLTNSFPPIAPPRTVAHIASLASEVQRDVKQLHDDAPSLGLSAVIGLAEPRDRAAFLRDLQAALAPLTEKYPAEHGREFRMALACYPTPGENH